MSSSERDLDRSAQARRLAEAALEHLVTAFEGNEVPIVVLGGLVPEILTRGQEPPVPSHLGTTDVDLHLGLSMQLDGGVDLSTLENALIASGFQTDSAPAGYGWSTMIEGHRVKVEFLCELGDQPQGVIVIPLGCSSLRAVNLRGTGVVTEDYEWISLAGETTPPDSNMRRVRVAGLQSFLLSKVHSAWQRGEEKDYYDLIYTLIHNRLGGPREAAWALASGVFRNRIHLGGGPWPEMAARFETPNDIGPTSYARGAILAHPEEDFASARQDAVSAFAEFLASLTFQL